MCFALPRAILARQSCRYVHTHRTITVQLTADVPGLGSNGSVHKVPPGRMRNYLVPQKLARYVLRGEEPEKPVSVEQPVTNYLHPSPLRIPKPSLEDLRHKLAALPPLIFHRRVQKDIHGTGSPIYGSVRITDIEKQLQDSHAISLTPSDAIVFFREPGQSNSIRETGQWTAEVRLKNGDIVPLAIHVQKQTEETAA